MWDWTLLICLLASLCTLVAATDIHIKYHGGPLLTGTRRVHLLFYGTWNEPSMSIIKDFISGVSSTAWWSIHREYTDRNGVPAANIVLGNVLVDKFSQGNNLTRPDEIVKKAIGQAIDSGAFHGRQNRVPDGNGIYVLVPSDDISFGNPCFSFCGGRPKWTHSSGIRVYAAFGLGAPANAKHCPSNKCGVLNVAPNGNMHLDVLVSTLSYQIMETINNPENNAWKDDKGWGSLGKCIYKYGDVTTGHNGAIWNLETKGRKFLVFQNWSPMTQGCRSISYTAGDGYCRWCLDYSLKSPNALQSNVNADLYGMQHRLSMQWDGNLVLYNGHSGYNSVWKNYQWTPKPTSFYRLVMQNDGNLVQYDSSGRWVWDTRTGGRPQGKYCLKVENNGNLKIFDSYCNTVWSRF